MSNIASICHSHCVSFPIVYNLSLSIIPHCLSFSIVSYLIVLSFPIVTPIVCHFYCLPFPNYLLFPTVLSFSVVCYPLSVILHYPIFNHFPLFNHSLLSVAMIEEQLKWLVDYVIWVYKDNFHYAGFIQSLNISGISVWTVLFLKVLNILSTYSGKLANTGLRFSNPEISTCTILDFYNLSSKHMIEKGLENFISIPGKSWNLSHWLFPLELYQHVWTLYVNIQWPTSVCDVGWRSLLIWGGGK